MEGVPEDSADTVPDRLVDPGQQVTDTLHTHHLHQTAQLAKYKTNFNYICLSNNLAFRSDILVCYESEKSQINLWPHVFSSIILYRNKKYDVVMDEN